MPRNGFGRRSRLTGSTPFKSLFGSKLAARSERFIVQAAKNGLPFARLGIVVGKHAVKGAVHRNFLKRLIRETFRHHQEGVSGYDVLVRVRRQITRLESRGAQLELTRLLRAVVQ